MRGEEPGPELVEDDASSSIGHYLASQRKLRGISLDELATRTRIPRRNLERLESGVFDHQPDGFVRGFVRTVAEDLGLDPQEAVMRLLGEPDAGDEDIRRRRRRQAAVAAFVLGGALLVAVGWGLREVARWLFETAPDTVEEQVVRRDAIRALADEVARDPRLQALAEAATAPEPAGAEAPAEAPDALPGDGEAVSPPAKAAADDAP